MEEPVEALNSLGISNLWEASRRSLYPRDLCIGLDRVVNYYLPNGYPGGIPERFHTGGKDYHHDTVPRPLNDLLCLGPREGWNELYFQFGIYDGKAEFSIPWGRDPKKRKDSKNRKILANYYRDSIDKKPSWFQGLDTALVELATGVRIPKPKPRWPMVQEIITEIEICEIYRPKLRELKPSIPQKPICKVKIMSWDADPREVRTISAYPEIVAFQPGLSRRNTFYAVHSVKRLPDDKIYDGLYGSSRIRNVNRSAILGEWDKPDVSEAVWVFGIHPAVNSQKVTVFSLIIEGQSGHPVLLARATRDYDFRYGLKRQFIESEYFSRVWWWRRPPGFFYGKIHHDFLLELIAISLLYGEEKQPLHKIVRSAALQGILPVAFYKEGRLYPVNEDNIRNCQQIILGALEL